MSEIVGTVVDVVPRTVKVKAHWKPGSPIEPTMVRKVKLNDGQEYDCWIGSVVLVPGRTYRFTVEYKPNARKPGEFYKNLTEAREMSAAFAPPTPGAPMPAAAAWPTPATAGPGEEPFPEDLTQTDPVEPPTQAAPPAQPLGLPDILHLKCPHCGTVNVYSVRSTLG